MGRGDWVPRVEFSDFRELVLHVDRGFVTLLEFFDLFAVFVLWSSG